MESSSAPFRWALPDTAYAAESDDRVDAQWDAFIGARLVQEQAFLDSEAEVSRVQRLNEARHQATRFVDAEVGASAYDSGQTFAQAVPQTEAQTADIRALQVQFAQVAAQAQAAREAQAEALAAEGASQRPPGLAEWFEWNQQRGTWKCRLCSRIATVSHMMSHTHLSRAAWGKDAACYYLGTAALPGLYPQIWGEAHVDRIVAAQENAAADAADAEANRRIQWETMVVAQDYDGKELSPDGLREERGYLVVRKGLTIKVDCTTRTPGHARNVHSEYAWACVDASPDVQGCVPTDICWEHF